jgi:hypothetical protein
MDHGVLLSAGRTASGYDDDRESLAASATMPAP